MLFLGISYFKLFALVEKQEWREYTIDTPVRFDLSFALDDNPL
jgi:hypothetical protein